MKKFIDKFVIWSVFWSLVGLINCDEESKLEKLINEVYRA